MNKTQMEFRNDLSKTLTNTNRALMNVFIYSQMVCVFLVLLLSHHDYTYLTNAGHIFLESILLFFIWISVITIVGNLMIRGWRKIFKLQSNQCSIWL
jgi:phosphate starvation-inducible membrane PsiE